MAKGKDIVVELCTRKNDKVTINADGLLKLLDGMEIYENDDGAEDCFAVNAETDKLSIRDGKVIITYKD